MMARRLLLVLQDQLLRDSNLLRGADAESDVVVMAELGAEHRRLPFHKRRIALILAAMRHFREDVRDSGLEVDYQHIDDDDRPQDLRSWLQHTIEKHEASEVRVLQPGDHRQQTAIEEACSEAAISLKTLKDGHFISSLDYFREWASGRKRLTLEYFYRQLRRDHDVLLHDDEPVGGDWNYDDQNRESFSSDGPGLLPAQPQFPIDTITEEVLATVEEHFPDHPGALDDFDLPVTPSQASETLTDFIANRLPSFGTYQDAMWMDEPFLYHSRLSASLNLHLLDPMDSVRSAENAYRNNAAPLNAVEGFIRQILGWREFVRGIYFYAGEEYGEHNALDAREDLPEFFWTAETEMICIRQTVSQIQQHAYAHHIQRLMVTGLFSLLYGADPAQFDDWHMAMYLDAWPWVSAPNTIGMSQYADGGLVATKPYIASGKYMNRMSNYCQHCPYDPDKATGDDACPFTTMYWDFLMRHEEELSDNRRMNFQLANLRRKDAQKQNAIRSQAETVRDRARRNSL